MASTRSTIDLIIRGSLNGLTGAVGTASAELEALRQRAERLAPVGERATSALLGLGKAMLAITAVTSASQVIGGVVVALEQLLPIALLAPAAISLLGATFATVKIGFSGFGDAVKKGGADLAKLSPQARATAQALRDMAPAFKEVKSAVQESLFKGLSTEVAALGRTYMPLLKTGLSGIAQPLNGLITGFIRVAKSGQSVKDVNTVLSGTKTALKGIEPAAGAVLSGFLTLAAAGIKSFAGIGGGITNVAIKFRDWAKELVVSGRFDVLVARAKEAFGQIFSIVGNVGSAIASIFRGLSSGAGSPLESIQKLTAGLAEFLKTAAAQDALKSLGDAFRTIADVTRTVLLEALKQLTPIIIDLAPFVSRLAEVFGTRLVNVLKIVGPILDGVAKFLSANKEIADVLVPIIGALAARFALLKVGTAVITGIRALTTAFGGLKNLGLVGLAAGIAVVADKLNAMNLATVGGDPAKLDLMGHSLNNIVEAGKEIASGDIPGILKQIEDQVKQTSDAWAKGQTPIQQWIDKVKKSFSSDLLAPMEAFGTRVNGVIDKIVKSFSGDFLAPLESFGTSVNNAIKSAITGMESFGTSVNGMITSVITGMSNFGAIVNQKITEVVGFLAQFPIQAVTAMASFGTLIAGVATTAWNGFITVTSTQIGIGVAQIGTLPGRAVGALSSFGTLIAGVATSAWNSFITVTSTQIGIGIAQIGTLPGRAVGALSSLSGLITGVASTAWQSFLGAVQRGTAAVVGFVSGIPGRISAALSGLPGQLLSIGSNAIASLGRGISSGFGAIQSSVANFVSNLIASAKAQLQINSPSRVFAEIGSSVGEGMALGINSSTGQAIAAARSMTDQIIAQGEKSARSGLIASSNAFMNGSRGGTGAASGITSTSAPLPVTIPIHIGDEVVRVVRTEIDTSNRDVRRTVRAGAGVTAG